MNRTTPRHNSALARVATLACVLRLCSACADREELGNGTVCAVWTESFEADLDFSRWAPSNQAIVPRFTVTPHAGAKDGSNVLKLAMQAGDSSGTGRGGESNERAEIELRDEVVTFDRQYWYRFSFLIYQGEYPVADSKAIVHQMREDVRPGGDCVKPSPFFAFEAKGEENHINAWFRVTASVGCSHDKPMREKTEVAYGVWHHVQVHILPSHDAARGFAVAWIDGDLAFNYTGLLGYADNGLGRVSTQPRFGVYRDEVDSDSTLYFDSIVFWDQDPASDPRWKEGQTRASPLIPPPTRRWWQWSHANAARCVLSGIAAAFSILCFL